MLRLFPICVLLLSACNTPGLEFRGLPASRITVGGSVFDVRVRYPMVEAIRINPRYAPRLGPIGAEAAIAIEQVSGCPVYGVLGDQAVITGFLICDEPRRLPDKRK